MHVPYDRGLAGHSDGDVLTHAVADALIGALGEGDIGRWFPDSDETYRGIKSLNLLEMVAHTLSEKGWTVGNVDATVVAEQPRLSPHLDAMRTNLARALSLQEAAINVKATSPEGIGSLGHEDAIAAFATALIELAAAIHV